MFDKSAGALTRPCDAAIYFTLTCPVAIGLELSVPSKLK